MSEMSALQTQDYNSNPEGLRPSTLTLGHGGSPQFFDVGPTLYKYYTIFVFVGTVYIRFQGCFRSIEISLS